MKKFVRIEHFLDEKTTIYSFLLLR